MDYRAKEWLKQSDYDLETAMATGGRQFLCAIYPLKKR